MAVNPNILVFYTPWSAPGRFKTYPTLIGQSNGATNSFVLSATNGQEYANYLVGRAEGL